LYENKEGSNYRTLREMKDEEGTFVIEYPDGTAHQFDATVTVKIDAGTINGALTFSATMTLTTDITVTDPTED